MMKKVTLLFAALMITLGVSAQQTHELQTPDANGYFNFATEFLGMEECTETTKFTDGMLIAIQHDHTMSGHDHEGHYLEINSKEEYGVYKMRMFEKCHGLSAFILVKVDGGFKLQTVLKNHFVGNLAPRFDVATNTANEENAGIYNFTWRNESTFSGFSVDCGNGKSLNVNATGGTIELCGAEYSAANAKEHHIFKIYQLSQPNGITGYVENAKVTLTGPNGNKFETLHSGWNDFFEFTSETENKDGSLYGLIVTNVKYHEATNEITGNVTFPFSVSGDEFTIPVHLYTQLNGAPYTNDSYRVAAVAADGTGLTVATKPNDGWVKDKKNQWAIIPTFGEMSVTYAIKNLEIGKYINAQAQLADTPTEFSLSGKTVDGEIVAYRFACKKNNYYTYFLKATSDGNVGLDSWSGATGVNFWVPNVLPAELDGELAKGFTRYYTDELFWDDGKINPSKAPSQVKANLEASHGTHELYSARTGIRIPQPGTITVTFGYDGGDKLEILGVDILDAQGNVKYSDYHVGQAGNRENNVYTMTDVVLGSNYSLRYWVCNGDGHDLTKTEGSIVVTGADYYLKYSNAPLNGSWAANTTWFRVRLYDRCERYISAQPAYMDAKNNLMLTNNTPPTDYAGMWAIVGNATDGYKFYNHAWGPEYALKTTGANADARTFMAPVDEATTYDIVQNGDYKFYVKVHGSDNNYLNMNGGDYGSKHLMTWNDGGALGDDGSVMTFETVLMDEFEANTEKVKQGLVANWNPWVGNDEVHEFVASISDSFVQLMLKRNDFSILDGKVFKFVNKGPEDDDRRGRVLRVDANNNMAGVVSQGDLVDDFLQIVDNGDGTFKLLHLLTNKYFQLPSEHSITEKAADAAAYSYKVYDNEEHALCFVSGNEMMHLGNGGYDYTTIDHNNIASGASRWDVIYNADAQGLMDLIEQAKERYAATQEPAYQANVGVPGYANNESTTALNNAINDNSINNIAGKLVADVTNALKGAMDDVAAAEKKVFFPTDCYFTITNRGYSLVYNAEKTERDDAYNSEFIWTTDQVDKMNVNHLWGFYQDVETGDYYLYNVGKKQFANSKGKGSFWGNTWIFSDFPVTITMKPLDTPYFHIEGDNYTMSVSTGYVGPVITYYEDGDQGVPMQFNKSTVAVKNELLEELESMGVVDFAPGFYTLKYNNLYLNDTRLGGNNLDGDGRRTLTEMTADKIDNIFYYTPNKEMVGYKSGYGFTCGYCNTGKPETAYNTFTFETSSEPGKYLIHSATNGSPEGYGDRYLLVDGDNKFTDVNAWNKKLAAAWTIEAVTELPVKLTTAQNLTEKGAYGTIWSPVALEIPEGLTAYTGYVTSECVLVLEAIKGGVIPAETGVVLWNPKAEETYTENLTITEAVATGVSNDNKFVGWVMTKTNPNTVDGDYYSLGKKNERMAFYRYVGANLQGFRARIERGDAPANASVLTIRFNNATGIEEVISAFQNGAVYDLSGRRVATPTKGTYIVNGKKVFIK